MMRYRATILGGIWMPYGAECSIEVEYSADDDEAAIEAARTTEAGDFSSVKDVRVEEVGRFPLSRYAGRIVKDWESEENEDAYLNTLG